MPDTAPDQTDVAAGLPEPPPIDAPADDVKPRRTRRTSSTRKPRATAKPRTERAPRAATPRAKPLDKRLSEAVGLVGLGVGMADPVCGGVIAARADDLGRAIANVARENPALAVWLDRLLTGTVYGELFAVSLSIALPIAAHHGMLPTHGPAGAMLGALAQAATDEATQAAAQQWAARPAQEGQSADASAA